MFVDLKNAYNKVNRVKLMEEIVKKNILNAGDV